MSDSDYLNDVLDDQTLADDSSELKDLRSRRDEIEGHLRDEFGKSPSIRYAGSHAKGTMIRESYYLDLACYFPRDDDDAGGTLEDIYNNVKKVLDKHYFVDPKTSALRVKSRERVDFHVDVVPGRFVNDEPGDAFLFCSAGDKKRLKTNIDTHISHVKDSGVTDAIRLVKLWRTRNAIEWKTFVLELAVVDVLDGSTAKIDRQLRTVLERLRDDPDSICIKDPANPEGNDLSGVWNEQIKKNLAAMAKTTLTTVDSKGWESVFGPIQKAATIEQMRTAAAAVASPSRPWCR